MAPATGVAVGYIRKSSSAESAVSEPAQRAAIAQLAAQHGYTVEKVYRDWGRSGGDEKRDEYLAMLARIEHGGIDAVLAYDQDRLARSAWMFAGLLRLARGQRFAVLTPAGNLADRSMRVVAGVKSYLDEAELDLDKERAQVNAAHRKARGDDDGAAPYGYRRQRQTLDGAPLPPLFAGQKAGPGERFVFVVDDPGAIARVVQLYRQTRSLQATARALNAAGVPARWGGAWTACTVQRVVDRNAPQARDGAKGAGVRAAAKPRALSRLLRCHCGQVMSPAEARKGTTDYVRWYCRKAAVGAHGGKAGITEAKLLPLVMAEAARLRLPEEVLVAVGVAYDDRAERAAVEALRGKVADAIVTAALADLDAKRAAAGAQVLAARNVPPAVDWSQPVPVLHEVLSALWERVQLGPDLLPASYTWHVPEWRRE